jgi:thymidylate synthase (FAD)
LTTDRGVSHELVRHRVFSFAQESTRYCNYSKDKFGNELTFICPSWLNLNLGKYEFILNNNYPVSIAGDGYFKSSLDTDKDVWILQAMLNAELSYKGLLAEGCSPQEARQVLPNALKTEICMTGFASDWKKFFDLRYFEVTGKAHPDMKLLATMMKEECEKANIWNDIIKDNNEN